MRIIYKLLLIVLVSVLISCSESTQDVKNSNFITAETVADKMYQFAKTQANAIGARVAGSLKERKMQEVIENQLLEHDITYKIQEFPITYTNNDEGVSYNIIASIGSDSNKKTIILGAHYDSVGNDKPHTKDLQGFEDNISGVSTVLGLSILMKHSQEDLPYNYIFVFFGAEEGAVMESGLAGSRYYVQNMSTREKDNTVVMINFDSLFAGDYLYIYSNKPAYYEKGLAYAQKIDDGIHNYLKTQPGYTLLVNNVGKVYSDEFENKETHTIYTAETYKARYPDTDFPDTYVAQVVYPKGETYPGSSDHASFEDAGILYIGFESTNWDIGQRDGYIQYEGLIDRGVWHTGMDTITWIEENKRNKSSHEHLYTALVISYALLHDASLVTL